MSYMYIVHVILQEPYTFHFTDAYSVKYMKQRTMKYMIAIIYTDEILEMKDSRINYLFKEIGEQEYNALPYKKTDMIGEFVKNPGNFTFISVSKPYSLPILPNYKYCPEIKAHLYRNSNTRYTYPTMNTCCECGKKDSHSNN